MNFLRASSSLSRSSRVPCDAIQRITPGRRRLPFHPRSDTAPPRDCGTGAWRLPGGCGSGSAPFFLVMTRSLSQPSGQEEPANFAWAPAEVANLEASPVWLSARHEPRAEPQRCDRPSGVFRDIRPSSSIASLGARVRRGFGASSSRPCPQSRGSSCA